MMTLGRCTDERNAGAWLVGWAESSRPTERGMVGLEDSAHPTSQLQRIARQFAYTVAKLVALKNSVADRVMNPSSFGLPNASMAPSALCPLSNPPGLYRVMKLPDAFVNALTMAYACPPVRPGAGLAAALTVSHCWSANLAWTSANVIPPGTANAVGARSVRSNTASPGLAMFGVRASNVVWSIQANGSNVFRV